IGLSVAVVPAGMPLTVRATVCAGPDSTAVLIVDVPPAPCCTVRLVGLALIAKSGFASTTNDTATGGGAGVPAAGTVSGYVPGAVAAPAVNVKVELLPAAMLGGLKLAVAPAGRPVMVSAIVCALPTVTLVSINVVPLAPGCTLTVVGVAVIE